MSLRDNLKIYVFFLLVYVALGIYDIARRSEWIIDNCIAVVFVTFVFFLSGWFLIGKKEFVLFNAALCVHNLGSFGFYAWDAGVLAFDNVVHFLSAAVAAYIAFNFVSGRLCLRLSLESKAGRDNKLIMVLLVLSVVALLGLSMELLEFAGTMLFGIDGNSVGMLGVGADDAYMDTMTDMITNILGSIVGVLVYYCLSFAKASR